MVQNSSPISLNNMPLVKTAHRYSLTNNTIIFGSVLVVQVNCLRVNHTFSTGRKSYKILQNKGRKIEEQINIKLIYT